MIPQTKHLVTSIGVALGALIVVVGLRSVSGGMNTFSFLPPQTALVMDSRDAYEVVIPRDTTREDARISLMEKLRAYAGEYREPDVVVVEDAVSPEPVLHKTSAPVTTRCEVGEEIRTRNDWGAVNVTVAEGARIITSLAIDDAGFPLNTLQLPLSPVIAGDGTCLPSDMVGVLLDGTIVMPDTPVATDAEGLAGYAIDGFPLFGSFEDGKTLTSSDLDTCHGHVHTIIDQGVPTSMYHYHVTKDAPYTLGCLRGAF
jgi:hypothetical protein